MSHLSTACACVMLIIFFVLNVALNFIRLLPLSVLLHHTTLSVTQITYHHIDFNKFLPQGFGPQRGNSQKRNKKIHDN